MTNAFENLFNRAAIKPNGCIEFLGPKDGWGYGQVRKSGKLVGAHRMAYELCVANIPKGKLVLHTCDNPACINPKHLFIGTDQTNVDDREAKGRGVRVTGSAHWRSSINEDQARKIKNMLQNGSGPKEISELLGISQSIIKDINRGRSWRHI